MPLPPLAPKQQPPALKKVGAAFTPLTPTTKAAPAKPPAQEAPKPAPPPSADKVAEGLKKELRIAEEDDIRRTRTLLAELRKYRAENNGKMSIELLE